MTSSTILNSKKFRISLICAFFLILGGFPKLAMSQESTSENAEKKFEPKDVILEHISDSHSWPLALPFVEEKHIPLPVILYTDKGLDVFSSGNLYPEGTVYNSGKNGYKLEGNKIVAVDASGSVDEAGSKKILDFSITRNVISMFMTIALLLIIFLSISSAYTKRVGKRQRGYNHGLSL